jgi:hypothetical protein
MSETAKKLFDSIKAIAPGTKDMAKEIGGELKRMGVQGSAELAMVLFSQSNAYVPYGRGQNEAKSHDHEREGHERGGMSR